MLAERVAKWAVGTAPGRRRSGVVLSAIGVEFLASIIGVLISNTVVVETNGRLAGVLMMLSGMGIIDALASFRDVFLSGHFDPVSSQPRPRKGRISKELREARRSAGVKRHEEI